MGTYAVIYFIKSHNASYHKTNIFIYYIIESKYEHVPSAHSFNICERTYSATYNFRQKILQTLF